MSPLYLWHWFSYNRRKISVVEGLFSSSVYLFTLFYFKFEILLLIKSYPLKTRVTLSYIFILKKNKKVKQKTKQVTNSTLYLLLSKCLPPLSLYSFLFQIQTNVRKQKMEEKLPYSKKIKINAHSPILPPFT